MTTFVSCTASCSTAVANKGTATRRRAQPLALLTGVVMVGGLAMGGMVSSAVSLEISGSSTWGHGEAAGWAGATGAINSTKHSMEEVVAAITMSMV